MKPGFEGFETRLKFIKFGLKFFGAKDFFLQFLVDIFHLDPDPESQNVALS